MDPREYYLQHSTITDPGEHAPLLDDLAGDIGGLCSTVRGLVLHHLRGERAFGVSVPEDRRQELNTCFVSDMLERIVELDDRPLKEPRPPERRLVGCCRDFAVLLCATARHKGIPARVRFGFTAYRKDEFNYDHVVTECWDAAERRWLTVDPELGDGDLAATLTTVDSSRTLAVEFIPAHVAWQRCSQGAADPSAFGRAPGDRLEPTAAIRHSLLHDLAALNRAELLLWSAWGLAESGQAEEEEGLLDQVAELAGEVDGELAGLLEIYEAHPSLRAPDLDQGSGPKQSLPESSPGLLGRSRSARQVRQPRLP
ncbi:MAG: transglutaminase-like domain-containing protein [Anaerolineae bacterium]|nr:transglutaminase-like domain-containing protein [Anaerolineae bacterium]